MKKPFATCIAIVLLAAFSNAYAGVIFVPVGNVIVGDLDLATVEILKSNATKMQIRSRGLAGELTQASGATGMPGDSITYTQQREISLDAKTGAVNGYARGQLTLNQGVGAGTALNYQGQLTGTAFCRPFQGRECGQVIVNLTLRGAISDGSDPSRVGLIRTEILGSLITNPSDPHWAAYSPNFVLGGDAPLIEQFLDTMDEGETTGVFTTGHFR